jgi:hypothetical protein
MGIKFTCPNGHKLNVKPFLAGKRAVCPKCGVKMRVPLESQTATANSDGPHLFDDPQYDGFDRQESAGRQDSTNRYNSIGPLQNGVPDFGIFAPEGEEDDVLWTDDAAAESPRAGAGPLPDATLNEAAFLGDPLDDPQANAALADAALVDPALADPAKSRSATPARPPRSVVPPASGPPPLRPPVSRPATPNSAPGVSGQRGIKPVRPHPALQAMSGAAVDEVIAAAATAPRPAPPPPPAEDPIVRFRLQLKRRNRIMMMLSAVLAVVVVVLAIVLAMVLTRQQVQDSSDQPASTAKEPVVDAPLHILPVHDGPVPSRPAE